MKAIEVSAPGPHYELRLSEFAQPQPKSGEVLIKVAAAGLNRADLIQAQGGYPPPPGAPATLGMEVSGEIAALGPEVRNLREGDKVCALLGGGGYAEYCAVSAGSVLAVPRNVGLVEAAALPEVHFTVWTNLIDSARLKEGESVLVHGGSSGIGTAAIQLCSAMGHRVFATAGSKPKCDACKALGATRAINYRDEDFVEVIKSETGGRGVDVILDMVGGDYIQRNISALALEGRIVYIAFLRGAQAEVNFTPLMLKRGTITGSTLRARTVEQKGAIAAPLKRVVWPLLDQGKVKPVIHRTFPLADASEAHRLMESSAHIGKIVLEV